MLRPQTFNDTESDEEIKSEETEWEEILQETNSNTKIDEKIEIYFEKQFEDSALCGQHSVNNLLQGPYYTAWDLGCIGAQLDQYEHALLDEEDLKEQSQSQSKSNSNESSLANMDVFDKSDLPSNNITGVRKKDTNSAPKKRYSNVSLEGLFSIEVLKYALNSYELTALPINHPDAASAKDNPEMEDGYICFQTSHWVALRRIENSWYNLNSISDYSEIQPQPVKISDFYLSALLSQLQDQGFQVFVVRGEFPRLGRLAPKAKELQGQYAYYNSLDIKTQPEIFKMAKEKQKKYRNAVLMNGRRYSDFTGRTGNGGIYQYRPRNVYNNMIGTTTGIGTAMSGYSPFLANNMNHTSAAQSQTAHNGVDYGTRYEYGYQKASNTFYERERRKSDSWVTRTWGKFKTFISPPANPNAATAQSRNRSVIRQHLDPVVENGEEKEIETQEDRDLKMALALSVSSLEEEKRLRKEKEKEDVSLAICETESGDLASAATPVNHKYYPQSLPTNFQ